MDGAILYGVLGTLGAIAIVIIVVSTCLICKEKKKHKNKKDKKKEKYQKIDGDYPRVPVRATHPTTLEKIQPTTDSELGKSARVSVDQRRARSAAGFNTPSKFKRTSDLGAYHAMDVGNVGTDSESDTRSARTGKLTNRNSNLSNSLLTIPFERGSRPNSPAGSSASEAEKLKKRKTSKSKSDSGADGCASAGAGARVAATANQLGSLYISLHYEFQDMSLVLKILRAKRLEAKDLGGTSDPYVRIMLLPDKKHKLETKVKHKSLDPTWNETFLFERFPYDKLKSRTIHLLVLDKDRFTADDPIGEVFLPLSDMDLAERTASDELELPLQPIDRDSFRLGEILLALTYDSNREKLTLTVIKCHNLKAKDISTGSSDPFVKVWQMRRGERIVKHKTAVLRKNLNPVYNESFVFSVTQTQLHETSLHLTVRDHDTVGANETIGGVVLGAKGGVTETKHWMDMIAKGKKSVSAWHVLKKDADA